MAVKATFKLANPDALVASMSISMTLEEWKRVRESLPDTWPHWQLKGAITDLVMEAEKVFYAEHESR
jgi:hypothetical protein